MKNFPNGFTSWQETHFEIVTAISSKTFSEPMAGKVAEVQIKKGYAGLYELAENLTDAFEKKFEGVEWGLDLEWFDEIEKFISENLT